MIVLDTNVLSEPLRAHPNPAVLNWLAGHPLARLTAISVGELLVGVALLPAGARRDALGAGIHRVIAEASDVLAYDAAAAEAFAEIRVARKQSGHALSVEDGMIAAICVVHGATLATRNTKDFEGLGLSLVNPWDA